MEVHPVASDVYIGEQVMALDTAPCRAKNGWQGTSLAVFLAGNENYSSIRYGLLKQLAARG
jgi:hypothetical protein